MISIGIVAHLNRMNRALELGRELRADTVSVDDGTLGCARNHIVVLSTLRTQVADNESWCVVLEDDAVAVPDFLRAVERALCEAITPVVGFYLGTGNHPVAQQNISRAIESDDAWIASDYLINGVGYAVHSWYVWELLQFISDRNDEELPLRITRWLQANDLYCHYTNPSLVDHADVPSIIAPDHTLPSRRAWVTGVRTDYDTPATELGWCPIWSAPA